MFKYRLKALREDQDLTQAELAKILHITRQALSNYENLGSEPNYALLVQIADYFNVSLDYLLGRTNKIIPFYNNIK